MPDVTRWKRLLLESFVPVVMLFTAIFLALLYVQFRTEFDAEKAIVVDIHPVATSVSDEALSDGADEQAPTDPERAHAKALMAEKKWAEAERAFRKLLAKHPGAPALRDLGKLYLKKGDTRRALEYFDRALKVDPGYVSAMFNRALTLAHAGHKHKAMAQYRALLARQPDHFQAMFNFAELQVLQGDLAAGADTLQRAVRISSGKHKAHALYQLGIVRRDMGQPDAARRAFEAAIRLLPSAPAARVGLATLEAGTPEGQARALEQYRKVVELAPDYAPALINMAAILSAQGKPNDAEHALRQAIRAVPNDVDAHSSLGLLLLNAKHWQEARTEFEEVLSLDKHNASAYFNLGRIAYGEKAYDKAESAYRAALKAAGGKFPEALVNLGVTQVARKDYKGAQASYQAALKLKPDNPETWYNLGMLNLRRSRNAQAEQAFKKAAQLRPGYEQAWFNLGVIYSHTKRGEQAIKAYRKALEIRPDYPQAQINLAVRYVRQKDYSQAIQLYQAVLAKDDTYAIAWFNLGTAYLRSGKSSDAVTAYRKAADLEPGNSKTLRHLGIALLQNGQADEAVQVLQNAVAAAADDARLRLELARALRQSGRTDEANAELAKARQLNPKLREDKEETDAEESSGP